MDRRFAWLGAAVGAVAVWRWRRRKESVPEVADEHDPAASLRAKLEESRVVVDEPAEPPPAATSDPDARRKSVHEDARARLDELKGDRLQPSNE